MDRGETLAQAVVRVREAGGAFSASEVCTVLQGEDVWATVSLPQVRRAITAANTLHDDAAKAERKAAKAEERQRKQSELEQQRDRSGRKRPAEERAAEQRSEHEAFAEEHPAPLVLIPGMIAGKITPERGSALETPPSPDAWYCSLTGSIQTCHGGRFHPPGLCIKPSYASPEPAHPYNLWKCHACNYVICMACCKRGGRAHCFHELELYTHERKPHEPRIVTHATRMHIGGTEVLPCNKCPFPPCFAERLLRKAADSAGLIGSLSFR